MESSTAISVRFPMIQIISLAVLCVDYSLFQGPHDGRAIGLDLSWFTSHDMRADVLSVWFMKIYETKTHLV